MSSSSSNEYLITSCTLTSQAEDSKEPDEGAILTSGAPHPSPRPAELPQASARAATAPAVNDNNSSYPSVLHQELRESKAIQEAPVPQNLIRVPSAAPNPTPSPPPLPATPSPPTPTPSPPSISLPHARQVRTDEMEREAAEVGGADVEAHVEETPPPSTDENSRYKRWFFCAMGILILVIVAVAVTVPVVLTLQRSTTGDPAPSAPTTSSPTQADVVEPPKCFDTKKELQDAVDAYLRGSSPDSEVASTYGGSIDEWCVGKIDDFSHLFSAKRTYLAGGFNAPLGSWNMSSATTMNQMFRSAVNFNSDVSAWKVEQAVDFSEMFRGATSFDQDLCAWQPILERENVQVTNMFLDTKCKIEEDPALSSSEFRYGHFCSVCVRALPPTAPTSQAPSPKDTVQPTKGPTRIPATPSPTTPRTSPTASPVSSQRPVTPPRSLDPTPFPNEEPTPVPAIVPSTPPDPASLKCFDSTQELYDAVDAYLADSSSDTNVAGIYGWPIGNWCVSQVTNFESLFDYRRNPAAARFDEALNGWDTGNAVNLRRMFQGDSGSSPPRSAFNQNLNLWNTTKVTDMSDMFAFAASFDGQISSWEVSSVITMSGMFRYASSFEGDLSTWNPEKVINMDQMFYEASSFNSKIHGWNVQNAQNMNSMFFSARSFNQSLCAWGPQLNSTDVNVRYMFSGASSCPSQLEPNLAASPPGPFCHICT